MKTEIIVAIIGASSAVLGAFITGVFTIYRKKSQDKPKQKIQGNGNIQAGQNINISGGVTVNAETINKRT